MKRQNAEHVVIIGYFRELLPLLISELKEGSDDYLQDTVCGDFWDSINGSCFADAGEYRRARAAAHVRTVLIARADRLRHAHQHHILFAQAKPPSLLLGVCPSAALRRVRRLHGSLPELEVAEIGSIYGIVRPSSTHGLA